MLANYGFMKVDLGLKMAANDKVDTFLPACSKYVILTDQIRNPKDKTITILQTHPLNSGPQACLGLIF